MKILVFSHKLVVSGTTMNAIELSAALRDFHGHDVVLFGTPGPMVSVAEEKALRLVPAPAAQFHPSLARMWAVREVIRRERPDVIHAWDWLQYVDSYYVAHLLMRVPMVVTDMSMTLQRMLPKALPTTFGTPEMVEQARVSGRRRPVLLLPPVDVHLNAPGSVDPQPFRDRYGIKDGEITLVTVSRLDGYMKGESLQRTIHAVRTLGRDFPLRFVLVGEGDARAKLAHLGDEVNTELGRAAIVLTGALIDPRQAYSAADIVVGMGSSALRGMAFGKPVVVVGENGFSMTFGPETAEFFYYRGFYGTGDGNFGDERLVENIRRLAERPNHLPVLGKFSRQFVLRNFALEDISAQLSNLCYAAATEPPGLRAGIADGARTAAVWLKERRFMPVA